MQTRELAKEMLVAAKAIQSDVNRILHPKRGFASMDPELQRAIASKGGKAAWALGTAHRWTSEEAQAAGRKGGTISRKRRRIPSNG